MARLGSLSASTLFSPFPLSPHFSLAIRGRKRNYVSFSFAEGGACSHERCYQSRYGRGRFQERPRGPSSQKTGQLKVGPNDDDDFGPVINEEQLLNMLEVVKRAEKNGAVILTGGKRMMDTLHRDGFYMSPTLIEGTDPHEEISTKELFGPIACLYRASGFNDALQMAEDSPYGLTACIHTRSIHRAIEFSQKIRTGVAVVNAGTYGSEPHMPFGGTKMSGNGSREPGTEALDIYSELKDIYINILPKEL